MRGESTSVRWARRVGRASRKPAGPFLTGTPHSSRKPRIWLRRLGDGLGVAVIVLVPLEEWFDVLGRQKVDVMAQSGELSPDVMGARASLHADQADRHIGQAGQ
jgi:hypothetical protein